MRMIDSDALLDAFANAKWFCNADRDIAEDLILDANTIDDAPAITGETSDGYHAFNDLYHHRAVLFSVIVKAFPDRAWKSRKHHDGSMYDGMFIVGIETPDGQATYHYDIDPYWDMFKCEELEYAPEWDGHTPAQAISRIGKLEPVRHGRWIELGYACGETLWACTSCANTEWRTSASRLKWCPNCGAKMDGGEDGENT